MYKDQTVTVKVDGLLVEGETQPGSGQSWNDDDYTPEINFLVKLKSPLEVKAAPSQVQLKFMGIWRDARLAHPPEERFLDELSIVVPISEQEARLVI